MRIGLYDPVKQYYQKTFEGTTEGAPGLLTKIAAGITTGAVAISIANPTDLVKVRMQAEGKLAPGQPKRYPSAFGAYGVIGAFPTHPARGEPRRTARPMIHPPRPHLTLRILSSLPYGPPRPAPPPPHRALPRPLQPSPSSPLAARQEGALALWTGVGPNIARNSVINAAELASYDQFKEMFTALGVEGVPSHVLSATGAGFVATCVGSPVDVIKSRVMGDKTGRYKGMVDCAVQTLRESGLSGFYKGFVPNFLRIASWNVVMFMTLEQLKVIATQRL